MKLLSEAVNVFSAGVKPMPMEKSNHDTSPYYESYLDYKVIYAHLYLIFFK